MKENNSRREFLSQGGKMVTAAALFGAVAPVAYAADPVGTTRCAKNTMTIKPAIALIASIIILARSVLFFTVPTEMA